MDIFGLFLPQGPSISRGLPCSSFGSNDTQIASMSGDPT